MSRRFEFVEGNSSKFWEIEQNGTSVTTWWGRIGTSGQSKTKDFSSEAAARVEFEKLVAEKTKKGYIETGSGTSVQPPSAAVKPNVVASAVPPQPASPGILVQPRPASPATSVPTSTAINAIFGIKPEDSSNEAAKPDAKPEVIDTTPGPDPAPGPNLAVVDDEELTKSLWKLVNVLRKDVTDWYKSKLPLIPVPWAPLIDVNLADFQSAEPFFKLQPSEQAIALTVVLSELKDIPKTRVLSANPLLGVMQVFEQLANSLWKRNLPLHETQLAAVVNAAADDFAGAIFSRKVVLTQVEEFLKKNGGGSELIKALRRFKQILSEGGPYSGAPDNAAQKLIHKVDLLIEQQRTGDVPIPIAPQEAWSDQALADLNALDSQSRQLWLNLIEHCGRTTGTTPSATWTKRANELVKEVGEESFICFVQSWFPLIQKKGSKTGEAPGGWGVDMAEVISPQNVEVLKGLAYCCAGRTDPRLASALGDAAEASFKKVTGLGPRSAKLGTACVHSLSSMNTKESIAQITRVQARAKHASVRGQIDKALNKAATKSGMSVDDLQDLGVPDFEMQESGKLERSFGDWTARLTIEDVHGITVTWTSQAGKSQQSVPANVKTAFADELKKLKKTEQELEKLLPGLRSRIERSYIDQRHWRFDQWRERYLEHPVISTIVRRLVWNFNGQAGIFWQGELVDLDGASFQPDDSALVELWHPIGADPDTVLRWRRWLVGHQVVQPFKQCHREIYVLTDAELETDIYSNRFAGHVLKQHQLQHLCAQRGWQYQLMGSFDSHSVPTLRLPRWDLTVELFVDIPGDNSNEMGIFAHVFSDKVHFLRCPEGADPGNTNRYRAVPLSEIMPIVFSEVMRDVDLFISVCSIGADPNWTEGYGDYWHRYSFGDLSSSAEMRKAVLADIIPHLRIASRCKLEGKFLIVEGDLRTYKIHLGSGNILMEPNDQYLCIVPGRGLSQSHERVFLPFEGDGILSIILSKAVLLADDSKIKDSSIMSQIKHKI